MRQAGRPEMLSCAGYHLVINIAESGARETVGDEHLADAQLSVRT